MYFPVFTYNNEIVNNISKIEFARGIINNAKFIPELDAALKRKTLISSVHASTAIEGNTLTRDEVGKILNGSKVIARKKEKQEVINYIHVLENINKYHKNGEITEKLLLKMHRQITKNTLYETAYEGYYRDVNVRVENLRTGEIRYTPPLPVRVPELIRELINWINNSSNISPLIVSGVAHYEFVRIHPFIDGNGRTARALATLILFIRGYNTKYFTVDNYYDEDRKAYVDALKSADDTNDLTKWLEYFIEGYLESIFKFAEELSKLLDILPSPSEIDENLNLKDDQIKIIAFLQENGKITNIEARELLNISSQAAYNKLRKLDELSIINRKGSGRSTYYVLNRVDEKKRKRLMNILLNENEYNYYTF